MRISVTFYSYVRDLTGCAQTTETLPDGSTIADLFQQLARRFPKLAAMERSLLLAVGVDYQPRAYRLKDSDDVAVFPPVQGG